MSKWQTANIRLYRHTPTAMVRDENGPWVSAHDVLATMDKLYKQIDELLAARHSPPVPDSGGASS